MPGRPGHRGQRRAGLLRRRRWLGVGLYALAGVVPLLSILDHWGVFHGWGLAGALGLGGYGGNDWGRFDRRRLICRRVVDAQTLEFIDEEGAAIAVRLLGVAPFPESQPNPAAAHLSRRVEGERLLVRLEPLQTRDEQGRLLAWAYLEQENLNLELIRLGWARADRTRPHPFRAAFEGAEREARRKKLGLWGRSGAGE